MVCCANLDVDLPVACHRQVAASTEVSLTIGKQANDIGSHLHIQHGCGDVDADVRIYFACAVVGDGHGENVCAKAIRIDFEEGSELVIACMQGRLIRRCFCTGLLLRSRRGDDN